MRVLIIVEATVERIAWDVALIEVIERVSRGEMSRYKDRRGSVILAEPSLCLAADLLDVRQGGRPARGRRIMCHQDDGERNRRKLRDRFTFARGS